MYPVRLVAAVVLSLPFALQAQVHVDSAPQFIEGPQTAPSPSSAPPQAPAALAARMTNDTVLKMFKAGLGEDLIVQTIQTQPGEYATDPDSLIALKQAGLSDKVIGAMMQHARVRLVRARPTGVVVPEVNEIGVYYKDDKGNWVAMEPEIVHIKSGGFIKSTVTNGIIKTDRNGHLDGRESKLLLPRPVTFLIYAPDGVAGNEYDFLRFRVNSNNREFRVLTGGVIHSTGGAQRDEMPFAPVRTGPHTYTFTVDKDTPGGEYGILPPGTGNVTNGGKIYTFAISE